MKSLLSTDSTAQLAKQPHMHSVGRKPGKTFLVAAILGLSGSVAPLLSAQPEAEYPGLTFTLIPEGQSSVAVPEPQPDAAPLVPLSDIQADRLELGENYRPFDAENIEVIISLANAYIAEGNHEAAIPELENALQIIRIQDGLESTSQVPVLQSLIDSHLALGDIDQADDMRALLFHVYERSYPTGSDALIAAQVENAEWNIEYFKLGYLYQLQPTRYDLTGSLERTIRDERNDLGFYGNLGSMLFQDGSISMPCAPLSVSGGLGSPVGINPIRSSNLISSYSRRLNVADTAYNNLLLQGEEPAPPELLADTHLKLAAILMYREIELNAYRMYMIPDEGDLICKSDAALMSNGHYRDGLAHLQQRLHLLSESDASHEVIAQAMLDMADWELVFFKGPRGVERLEEAHTYLVSSGLSTAEADAFINADSPVMLPRFITHQYQGNWSLAELEGTSGFMELEVNIRTDGKARNLRFTEYSEEANAQLRNILRNYVRDSTFRPLLEEGKVKNQDDLELRYVYQY